MSIILAIVIALVGTFNDTLPTCDSVEALVVQFDNVTVYEDCSIGVTGE